MKCPICGTEHNEKFCPNCGQKAAWDWNELDKKNEEGVKRTQNKVKMRRLTGLFVFLIILAIALMLLFADGKNPEMPDAFYGMAHGVFTLLE